MTFFYANSIPEDQQKTIRERLKRLRTGRNLTKKEAIYATPEMQKRWEDSDISGMKIYDVYKLAESMGWTLDNTFAFFSQDQDAPAPMTLSERRIRIALKNMSEQMQDAACDILERLSDIEDITQSFEEQAEPIIVKQTTEVNTTNFENRFGYPIPTLDLGDVTFDRR